MAQQLRKLGCAKVHVADHGLDALNFLSTTTFFHSTDQIPLSVVLLDVEMPVMDGLQAARRVRELEDTHEILRHVPIIGITANARVNQIASCIEAGMDEVLVSFALADALFMLTYFRPSLSACISLFLACALLLTSSNHLAEVKELHWDESRVPFSLNPEAALGYAGHDI